MIKYETLLKVLDQLRGEAPPEYKGYYPLEAETELLNRARSKSYIHLFLKVKFGLLEFLEREEYITEGTADGGIDAYYIDVERKKIYFIQSKFRTNHSNYVNKDIELREILKMDTDRISAGNNKDEKGVAYNSKIQNLIKRLGEIGDIARYNYEVILIANLTHTDLNSIKRLTGGFPATIMDYKKAYEELLFPVITGTYYNVSDLYIYLNLSDKVSTSSEISYIVTTEFGKCEITVVFVPTIEIAKILYKYKNAILKYNPRSYLDLSSNEVNKDIAKTILNKTTNEFALFNNGITMISDETDLSKRTGRQYRAQLKVTNPQIINGGQTAFTLSKIYEDAMHAGNNASMFENKEVLLKIITFIKEGEINKHPDNDLRLLEAISNATNQQTSVIEADRRGAFQRV